MHVFEGSSSDADGRAAVGEATRHFPAAIVPEIVFAFASTAQKPAEVAAALAERFPSSIVVGCSTTGEHLGGRHFRGALVVSALVESGIRWATASVEGVSSMGADAAETAVARMFESLGVDRDDFDPADYFCMSFIDGLRGREEPVTAWLAEALSGVRLVGGSAGDDLAFRETQVWLGGHAFTDGLVLVMGHAKGRFDVIKHQHFTTLPKRIAITKVDAASPRRVLEIDGLPAIQGYCRALGIAVAEATDDLLFEHPVTLSCDGQIYVRSVQKRNEDGSLSFFCALDEGTVLEIGGHHPIGDTLRDAAATVTGPSGPYDFFVGWNCILRAIEADKTGNVEAVGDGWRAVARASIGFDTYGEQVDGLHVNQTLTAIGIRRAA